MKRFLVIWGLAASAELLLFFLHEYALLPLGILVLTGTALSLQRLVNLSIIVSAYLSSIFMASITITLAAAAWLLSIPLSFVTIMACLIIVTLGLLLYSQSKKVIPSHTSKRVQHIDKASVIIAAFAFLLIITPLLPLKGNSIIQFLAFGGDNTGHIELTRELFDANKGFLYGNIKETEQIISRPLVGYPQGLHLITASILKALSPYIALSEHPVQFLRIYICLMALFFASLAFIATQVAYQVTSLLSKKKSRNQIPFIASALLSLGFATSFGFMLFSYGFQSFIFLLTLIFSFLFLYNREHFQLKILVGLTLITVAAIFTWLIIAPILAVALLAYIWRWQTIILQRKPLNISILAGVVAAGLLTFVQLYIQLQLSVDKGGINEQGSIAIPNLWLLTALTLASIAVVIHKMKEHLYVFIPLLITLFMTLIFFGYNIVQVGEIRYFGYKFSYILIFACIPFIAHTLSTLTDWIFTRINSHQSFKKRSVILSLFAASLVCALIATLPFERTFEHTAKLNRIIDTELVNAVIDTTRNSRSLADSFITVGSCNRVHDYLAMRLIHGASSLNGGIYMPADFSLISDSRAVAVTTIDNFAATLANKKLNVISSDNELSEYIKTYSKDKEKLIFTPVYKQQDAQKRPLLCPEMVH